MTVRMVAFWRGINVGKAKRLTMADVRAVLVDLGYTEVSTYLQSGNAVFTCTPEVAETTAADIERAVRERLGVEATVIVRAAEELGAVRDADPLGELVTDGSRYLVGFLSGEPDPEKESALLSRDIAPNVLRLDGRHLYLWCPNGILESPFATVNWERELGLSVTMRNWNTVTKVAALAGV